jgi:hypothetical protein
MRKLTKITLPEAPWPDEEEKRTWQYLVTNKLASAAQVAMNCDVTVEKAQSCIDRIGTPREVFTREVEQQSTTMDTQVGGDHYKTMGVQPWEAMEAWFTPEEYRGYHKGTAIGYIAREQRKGGLDDIKKAIHHLQRLVEYVEATETD